MRTPLSLRCWMLVALCACGGELTTSLDASTDAATADAMGIDSAPSDTGTGPCPAAQPNAGSSCPSESVGLACEYGANWSVACNSTFTCESDHTWHDTSNHAGCLDASMCPTSAPIHDSACTSYASCDYSAEHCICITQCGGIPLPSDPRWICQPNPTGCPFPRPDIGTPCASEGENCAYTVECCSGGTDLVCSGGSWRSSPTLPCP